MKFSLPNFYRKTFVVKFSPPITVATVDVALTCWCKRCESQLALISKAFLWVNLIRQTKTNRWKLPGNTSVVLREKHHRDSPIRAVRAIFQRVTQYYGELATVTRECSELGGMRRWATCIWELGTAMSYCNELDTSVSYCNELHPAMS